MKKNLILVIGLVCFLSSGCMATVSPGTTLYTRYWDVAVEPTVVVDSAVVVDTAPVLITPQPLISVPLFPLVVEHHKSVHPPRVVGRPRPVHTPLLTSRHNARPHVQRQPAHTPSHVSGHSGRVSHTSIGGSSHTAGKVSQNSHSSVSKSSPGKQHGSSSKKR
ncbi:MAG: hypothetical protein IKN49_03180 [Elusimicrobiaceae bacterium]|nr:hypothetical protein [Elusimicrobiaceae bacterium]